MDPYENLFGMFAAAGDNPDRGDDFTPTGDDAPVDDEDVDNEADEKKADEPAADEKKADDPAADEKKADEKVDDKEEPKKDKKERTIPESRFTEAIRKHKDRQEQLEARIKELEGQTASTKTSADIEDIETQIEKLQDEHDDAIADNNRAKAKEIRGKIRGFERTLIDLKASEKALAAKAETLEELRYEAAIGKVEADYPLLNPDLDEFDKDKADEVLQLRNGLMKSGVPAAKALVRAAKYVLGDPESARAKKDEDVAAETKAERERRAREKAADAVKKQPPDATRHGLDSDKAGDQTRAKSVAKMSQDQFAKLDEETLSKLRGDAL